MPQADEEPRGPGAVSQAGSKIPQPANWTLSRERTIVVFLAALAVFFVVTGFAVRFYHETRRSLARHWFAQGEAKIESGRAADAIEDIRTALVYSRENGDKTGAGERYELELAKALSARGSYDEARAYLIAAAERAPGNAEVSVELARLAAKQGSVDEASRYYSAAIFGAWSADTAENRRAARIEYAEFLLKHGQAAEAQAQLVAMAGALPPDAELLTRTANLLTQAGENEEAFALFQRALGLRKTAEAARGAGIAAYRLGNYREAEHFLSEASRASALDAETQRMLLVAEQAVTIDPLEEGISAAERAERSAAAFSVASKHLASCVGQVNGNAPNGATTAALKQLREQLEGDFQIASEAHLRAHPEDVSTVLRAVFAVESGIPRECGQLQPGDEALQLIARGRAAAVQQ